jgi:hypothetical protein
MEMGMEAMVGMATVEAMGTEMGKVGAMGMGTTVGKVMGIAAEMGITENKGLDSVSPTYLV